MSYEVVCNNDIYITRGDSACFELELTNTTTEEPYVLEPGDEIIFSLKHFISDRKCLIQKNIADDLHLILNSSDTSGLDYGNYFYDIQLIKPGGFTETFIENKNFFITPEVG